MGEKDQFRVWCPDYGETEEDAQSIESKYAARDVVGVWAERSDLDSAEYSIANGKAVQVCIRTPEGELEKYKVRGDWSPNYYAERIDDDPPSAQDKPTPAAGGKEPG